MATINKEFLAQYGVNSNSNKIINLATPTANTDAATKKYVDDQLVAAASNTSLASAAFTASNNTIVFSRADSTTTSVDIGSQTQSAAFAAANSTLTLTRADSTTFDVALRANTSLASAAFAAANSTLTFTRDDGTATDVALRANTSVSSAAFTGSNSTFVFTRDDASTFDVAMSDLTIDDLTISGNLTVQGTTTNIDTNNLVVNDAIITLASGQTGTPSLNAGIEIERGSSANVALRWNESTDKWQVTEDGTTYINIATGTDLSNIANTSAASGAYTVANNTLTITRDDASTFDVVLTGVANTTLIANTSTSSGAYTAANSTLTMTRADGSTFDMSIITSATTVSNTAPSSPLEGDLWYDSDDADLYIYYDGAFVAVVPTPANTSSSSASFASANSTLTITRADASTFDVALRANTSTQGAGWTSSNNTLTFTREDASTFDVTLDKLPTTATTTVSSTSQITIDSFAIATYSAAQYIVECTSGTDKHFTMVNVTQDGTDVYLTEYGTLITNASLMTLDASLSAGTLSLLATPANNSGTIKIKRTNVSA